jgi:hypothetical protein
LNNKNQILVYNKKDKEKVGSAASVALRFTPPINPLSYFRGNAIYTIAASGHFDAFLLCQLPIPLGNSTLAYFSAGITRNRLGLLNGSLSFRHQGFLGA